MKKRFLAGMLSLVLVTASVDVSVTANENLPEQNEVNTQCIMEDTNEDVQEDESLIIDSDDSVNSEDVLVDTFENEIQDDVQFGAEEESEVITEETEILEESPEQYANVSGAYTYTISGNEATITGYSGSASNLTIPDEIDGYSVTQIGSEAFKDCIKLVSVIVPNTIVKIQREAFSGCTSLNELSLPESLAYLGYSFIKDTAIKKITIPRIIQTGYTIQGNTTVYNGPLGESKVTEVVFEEGTEVIPSGICAGGIYIEHVSIPKSVKTIGNGAFSRCKSITSIQLQYNDATEVTENNEVQLHSVEIKDGAFEFCSSLKNVELTENVISIGSRAFSGCTSLEELTIPESVTYLGYNFIKDTAIKKLSIPKNVKNTKYLIQGNTTVYTGPLGESKVTKVVFEEGTEVIASGMCAGGSYIENVSIPKSVKTIGYGAFSLCKSITSIQLQYNDETEVTKNNEVQLHSVEIKDGAFEFCSSLKNVELTENVISIGSRAFSGCTSLEELTIPESVTRIDCWFIKDTGIKSITIPKNVQQTNSLSSKNGPDGPLAGSNVTEVIFEEGMTMIPYAMCSAGRYETHLEKALIPESVTSINDTAFSGCDLLTIFGVPGSYAETFADLNSIPFVNIKDFYNDLYKYSDFVIKVLDKETKKPINEAEVFINSVSKGKTDEHGILSINSFSSATQSIEVSKSGYHSIGYCGMKWSSSKMNTVYLSPTISVRKSIERILPNTNLGSTIVKGPEINIQGYKFNLFEQEMSFNLPLFDNLVIKNDEENKIINVMIGASDDLKAKIEAADPNDVYWSQSYREVKSLVKRCGGKVDTPKLWNQFSSMRGQLKEIKGTASIGVSGRVAGFIEFNYADGDLRMIDSGIAATLSGNVRVKVPYFWVVYGELGLKASADGTLKLTINKQKTEDLSGNIGISISPSLALGVDGIVADIKGGFRGSLDGRFSFPADNIKESLKLSISGELFISFYSPIPFIELANGDYPYDLGTLELYPDFGAYAEMNDWKLSMEERLYTGSGEGYEHAETQIVSLSDGTKVKVYITDDGTKTKGNHTTLMYSVFKNGVWTIPKAVCETGHADVTPVLRCDENTVYVIWMNIEKDIIEGMGADEIFPYTELYLSHFNGTGFDTPENVSDVGNRIMEYKYDLAVNNGNAYICWVENSENDPFMQNGNNTLYGRVRNSDGSWQNPIKMVDTTNHIVSTAVSVNGNSMTVSYSDGTCNYNASDMAITMIGNGSNVKVFDGILYYQKDSILYRLENNQGIDYGIVCTSDYKVFGNTVYWTEQKEFGREIYMQSFGSKSPVQITNSGGYIEHFAVYNSENNTVLIDYVFSELTGNGSNPYGKSSSKTMEVKPVYDLILDNVQYDILSAKPDNKIDFLLSVSNRSSETIGDIKLRVTENNKVIFDEIVLEKLQAGYEKELTYSYTLPKNMAGLAINFEIYSDGADEENLDNNYSKIEFADTDIVIREVSRKQILIQNNGYSNAQNVKVEIRELGSMGTLIGEYSVGTLENGETTNISISIPDKYIDFTDNKNEKTFWIGVTSDTPESSVADNYTILRVEPPHVKGVTLKTTEYEVVTGSSVKLEPVIDAEDGADKTLFWCSANTDIAVVTSEGIVKGVVAGETDITVISNDGGFASACHVIVTENEDANITGNITVSSGNPENVQIEILQGSKVFQSQSVSGNSYSISGLEAGNYTLRVIATGYITKEISVTVGVETVAKDITLWKTNDAAALCEASLSLEGQIGVNLIVNISEAMLKDSGAYAELTQEKSSNPPLKVKLSDAASGSASGDRVFTYSIAAKEINDKITIRIYSGSGEQLPLRGKMDRSVELSGNKFSYAAADYINSKKNSSTAIGSLMQALNDYGVAAEKYFQYGSMGAAGILADLSTVNQTVLSPYKAVGSGDRLDGVSVSASLMLESMTSINVTYAITGSVSDYTFTCDGKKVTPVTVGNEFQVTVADIAAKDLDKMHEFSITDKNVKTQTVKYSALSYAYSKVNSTGEVAIVAKTLYLYNQTAKGYFGN